MTTVRSLKATKDYLVFSRPPDGKGSVQVADIGALSRACGAGGGGYLCTSICTLPS